MNRAKQQGFIRRLWIMWHGRAMAMPALRWDEEGLDIVEEFYSDQQNAVEVSLIRISSSCYG
jgi:hypothetical protein